MQGLNQKNKCIKDYMILVYIKEGLLVIKVLNGDVYRSIEDPAYIPLLQSRAILDRIL